VYFETLNAVMLTEPELNQVFIKGKIATVGFQLTYLVALSTLSVMNNELGTDAVPMTTDTIRIRLLNFHRMRGV
jgi:hypothetical protein